IACPAPGNTSDRVNAACGSTSRRVVPRMTAAKGVPHVSHTSRKIALRAPHTVHGQNASPASSRATVAGVARRSPASLPMGTAPAVTGIGGGSGGGGLGGGGEKRAPQYPPAGPTGPP